jgi:hypothetical protein
LNIPITESLSALRCRRLAIGMDLGCAPFRLLAALLLEIGLQLPIRAL